MRISKDGCLLYANRASKLLLTHWIKNFCISPEDEGYRAFSRSVAQASLERADIICSDSVYTVTFAPVGNDYLNVYALDTTEKRRAELALKSALIEVHQLKNRLQQGNSYLRCGNSGQITRL